MNTSFEKFSLVWANLENFEKDRAKTRFDRNPEIIKMLGLDNINIFATDKLNLLSYVTSDVETITYRIDLFNDIIKNKELYNIFNQTHQYLIDIYETQKASKTADFANKEATFYSINEIELYITCIDYLYKSYKNLEKSLESKGFKDLFKYVVEIYESEQYKNLKKNVNLMSFRIHHLKSLTIGVNLNAQLQITEAGILSVNDDYFKSGKLIDKLLKFDMEEDEYTTIAALVPSSKNLDMKERQIMNGIFTQGLNKLYSASIKSWRSIINNFMHDDVNFIIKLAPEIKFILACSDIMFKLDEIGTPLCKPELAAYEEKVFEVTGLYNAALAIGLNSNNLVLNNITFDKNGMIYILTGPNRGGKSVITCAVGITQLFCQLGMLIPAKSAKISPVDCIYTHFMGNYNTLDKGRLGEECERLQAILNEISPYSLALFDETLSSTGSFEGSYIAAEIVEGLSLFGCKCIYTTHMHELASLVDEINARSKNNVDTLVAGMEEGKRSFKIFRIKPDGKSYAKDIAQKYGISLQTMKERSANYQDT